MQAVAIDGELSSASASTAIAVAECCSKIAIMWHQKGGAHPDTDAIHWKLAHEESGLDLEIPPCSISQEHAANSD